VLRLHGVDVRPAHRGEFRVLVAARRAGLGQLRGYLVADLLRRYAEGAGLAPAVIDLRPAGEAGLRAACGRLNIHPPGHTMDEPFSPGQLAGQFADGIREPLFDVGVRAAGEQPGAAVEALAGHWIEAAGVAGGPATDGELPELGEEPLAVRMKMMRQGYGEELTADLSQRDGEDGDLARWRQLVAGWARSPSGAMSRRHADAIAAAFADGLDTAAALRELAALAGDASVPDGVKFETFAAADRLAGLDLARDVGRS
jgi:hypothetical protein